MNKFLSTRIALAVAAAALGVGVAGAADRKVMCEEFNATWCGPCVPAGTALGILEDANPASFILVQIHVSDNVTVDPYASNRASFYNVSGIPASWFDGTTPVVGAFPNVNQNLDNFRNIYNTRLGVPTHVAIDMWATQVDADTWTVNARYTLENSAPGPQTMKLRIYQTRDPFPSGTHYSTALRAVSPLVNNVTLQPGETITQTWTSNLAAADAAVMSNIGYVAFAQETGSTAGPNSEILNAQSISHPFPTAPPIIATPGDTDEDGDIDLTDLATLLSNFGVTGGRNWSHGDFDGNGAVNLVDLATLLSNFGL